MQKPRNAESQTRAQLGGWRPLLHAERGPGTEGAAQAGSQLPRELFSTCVIRHQAAVRRDRESPDLRALRDALLGMEQHLLQLSS